MSAKLSIHYVHINKIGLQSALYYYYNNIVKAVSFLGRRTISNLFSGIYAAKNTEILNNQNVKIVKYKINTGTIIYMMQLCFIVYMFVRKHMLYEYR